MARRTIKKTNIMNTETFRIPENEINEFKLACNEVLGIEFIEYNNSIAKISYKYTHNLFFLGQMLQLTKQQTELCKK